MVNAVTLVMAGPARLAAAPSPSYPYCAPSCYPTAELPKGNPIPFIPKFRKTKVNLQYPRKDGWGEGIEGSADKYYILYSSVSSLKRREPKKTLHYSQSLVAFVNAICFICSEKSLSLYIKSKVSFLCLWHFFSLSSERIHANFMVFFPSSTL